MSAPAQTPSPPYYAVIFTSLRAAGDSAADNDYERTAQRMLALAAQQPGYLGVESARSSDALGITVSYWTSEEAIAAWRQQAEHLLAQAGGRNRWYARYELRVAKVERAYGFGSALQQSD